MHDISLITCYDELMKTNEKKILVCHDRFQFRGGGERLVLELVKGLTGLGYTIDLATEFWTEETFDKSEVPGRLFVLDAGEPRLIVWRYFRAQLNWFFKTKKFANQYDVVIFSGNNSLTAGFTFNKKIKKIAYIHSPVRYVYDLLAYRRAAESSLLKRVIFFDLGKYLIRFLYQLGLSQMNVVVANSNNVQERLQKYCHTESQVIYPPINIEKFQWQGQSDYYLSFARVDELKRIDIIVNAFAKMPDKKLKIASGGPELENIKKLASGHDNIEVIGWVSDEQLQTLVGQCIATVYIPIDEDFGMSPVESMAAGKPCIAVADGGLKESIIDGVTGVLIQKDFSLQDLVTAIKYMTPDVAAGMKTRCIEQASRFGKKRFVEEMAKLV